MFRALLCFSLQPGHYSSYSYSLQPGHYYNLTALNLQPTANQERNDQCGNQHYSRQLLMMGIVVPETCSAYKKYNKIISGMYLVFYSSVITMIYLQVMLVSFSDTVYCTPKVH